MNDLYPLFKARAMTFTEFELLARYCVNLSELYFFNIGYWRFMTEIDFTKQWLKLVKIPEFIGWRDNFEVYQQLKDRLVDISLRSLCEPQFRVMDLVNNSERVQSLAFEDSNLTLSTKDLLQMHKCYSQLKTLVLYTKLLKEEMDDDIEPVTTSLRSLSCTVDSPHSPWFSLFETWYKDIDSLRLRCNLEAEARSINWFVMVESILDILHSSNIQQLQFTFYNSEELKFIAEHAITETVYDDIICDTTPTISMNFDYADADDNNLKKANKLQCSISKKSSLREFDMRYNLGHEEGWSEIDFLKKLMKNPIRYQLTHLSLTRIITRGTHPDAYKYKTPRPLHLDSVLDYFPNLHSLKFTLEKEEQCYFGANKPPKNKDDSYLATVTLGDKNISSLHGRLQCLQVVSTTIDPSVYQYLFRKCPHLSSLILKNSRIRDDETLLALEYLCLENNVELIMIK
jgi:hypothetical protein